MRRGGGEIPHVNNATDPSLNGLLQAREAWLKSRIQTSPFNGDSKTGGRKHGILLGMHANALIVALAGFEFFTPFTAPTTSLRAVFHALRRSVISSTYDAIIEGDYRTNGPAKALSAALYRASDIDKISVKGVAAITVDHDFPSQVKHMTETKSTAVQNVNAARYLDMPPKNRSYTTKSMLVNTGDSSPRAPEGGGNRSLKSEGQDDPVIKPSSTATQQTTR